MCLVLNMGISPTKNKQRHVAKFYLIIKNRIFKVEGMEF